MSKAEGPSGPTDFAPGQFEGAMKLIAEASVRVPINPNYKGKQDAKR